MGLRAGPNTYGYVGSSPLVLVDATGLAPKVCCRRIDGIVGLLTGAVHCALVDEEGNGYELFPQGGWAFRITPSRAEAAWATAKTDSPKANGGSVQRASQKDAAQGTAS